MPACHKEQVSPLLKTVLDSQARILPTPGSDQTIRLIRQTFEKQEACESGFGELVTLEEAVGAGG